MCDECWIGCESPKIENDKVLRALASIDALYRWCPTGGRLHIVTDDWNIETQQINWCVDEIEKDPNFWNVENWHEDGETYSGKDEYIHELNCAKSLLELNEEERASALGLFQKHWQLENGHYYDWQAGYSTDPEMPKFPIGNFVIVTCNGIEIEKVFRCRSGPNGWVVAQISDEDGGPILNEKEEGVLETPSVHGLVEVTKRHVDI